MLAMRTNKIVTQNGGSDGGSSDDVFTLYNNMCARL